MGTLSVNIFSSKFTAVVVDRAFSHHSADCSFHKYHFLSSSGVSRGSVTLVKSNAKALLTAYGYQKCNPQAGFALSEGQGLSFEKDTLATPSKLPVTVVTIVTVF